MDLNEKLIKMRSVVFSVLYLKGYFNRKESTHTLILISLYIYRIFKISIRHTNIKTTQKAYQDILENASQTALYKD